VLNEGKHLNTGNSVAEAFQEQVVTRTHFYKNCLQNFDGVFSTVQSKDHGDSLEIKKQKVKSFL